MTAPKKTLEIHSLGAIWEITLSRPETLNAINVRMKQELREAIELFEADPVARVALIMGQGRAFSSGADRVELGTGKLYEGFRAHEIIPHQIRTKPLIAAVHGYCLGMALGLILECDLAFALGETQFQVAETNLGLRTGRYYELLKFVSGSSFAGDVCLTGRMFNAEEAASHGLVNIHPTTSNWRESIKARVDVISHKSELSLEDIVRSRSRAISSINASLTL